MVERTSSSPRPRLLACFEVVLVSTILSSSAGCGRDCPHGESKCVGNVVYRCPTEAAPPVDWDKEDCGDRFCVTAPDASLSGSKSFCALGAQRREACVNLHAAPFSVCDGAVMVRCYLDHAVGEDTCASEAHCQSALGTQACPVTASPDPRCEAAPSTGPIDFVCDGATSVTCMGNIVNSELDCAPAGCDPALGVCDSTGPTDPRCEAAAAAHPDVLNPVVCDANVALICVGAHIQARQNCGVGECISTDAIYRGEAHRAGCYYDNFYF